MSHTGFPLRPEQVRRTGAACEGRDRAIRVMQRIASFQKSPKHTFARYDDRIGIGPDARPRCWSAVTAVARFAGARNGRNHTAAVRTPDHIVSDLGEV